MHDLINVWCTGKGRYDFLTASCFVRRSSVGDDSKHHLAMFSCVEIAESIKSALH